MAGRSGIYSLLLTVIIFTFIYEKGVAQTDRASGMVFDFENSVNGKLPQGWEQWGMDHYKLSVDSITSYSGRYSLRMEAVSAANTDGFGSCVFTFPVPGKVKRIELEAAMKLQDIVMPVGLMLRIDDAAGKMLSIENMVGKDIKGTRDWAVYHVGMDIPEGAHTVRIGAILIGAGILWVDGFQVKTDGITVDREMLQVRDKFIYDRESRVDIREVSPQIIGNLAVICNVWGFVKYHHPVVAQGDVNMDHELFRLISGVSDMSDSQRNRLLLSWLQGLGGMKKENHDGGHVRVRLPADVGWIYDKKLLGTRLSDYLRQVYECRKTTGYYVTMAPHVGNVVFQNEYGYEDIGFPDTGFRLLALFRYWNMIRYYYPYRYLTDDWTGVLNDMIPRFIRTTDMLGYQLLMSELIARINDSQARLYGADHTLAAYQGRNYAPLEIDFIEDQAVVSGYFDQTLGEESGLLPGDIITDIDHVPVSTLIDKEIPYTSASNRPGKLLFLTDNLLRTNNERLAIGYLRNGEPFTRDIPVYPPSKARVYLRYIKERPDYRLLPDNMAYIYAGRLRNDRIDDMMKIFADTKGLIIDLRCHLADNIIFSLGEYLMPVPTGFARFTTPNVKTPGQFDYTRVMEIGKKNDQSYQGQIVILVNELTFSGSEFAAMAFRTAPGAIVIGSTTAGADGNISKIVLPGGLYTYISGLGVYYPDGGETQGVGIIPDTGIHPTVKGISENRDELMEKAIEIINGSK